ncbi:NADP-dependent oxidoreductase [Nocardia sp. N2S4-5]|uniref:NADP-dependent oxidoreductase n=1 Tax=Nocardia sp. N2S4-5 TaxID=3351565 RepID=UPI0037D1E999
MSQPIPSMRAVEYDRYGEPEVLTVRTVPRPEPGPRQVLVRVRAAAVNPADVKIRSGAMRLLSGRRFPKRTGIEFSGTVVAAGPRVTGIAVGEQVWGSIGDVAGKSGAAAEYVAVDAKAVGPAPASIELSRAAALPTGGVTALRGLRDTLKLAAGQDLLIIGAAGGVGSAAVQLGVAMGAKVSAVAGPANHELCRDLGATQTFDYAEPATATGRFDAILDCHGTALGRYRRLLRRRGRILTVAPSGMGYALLSAALPGPRVRLIVVQPHRKDLADLAKYVDSGQLRPVIEDVYPLDDIAKVHTLVETGHARGKRLLTT